MRRMGGLESLGLQASLTYTGDCILPGTLYDLGEYPGLALGSGRCRGELFEFADPGVFATLDAFEEFEPDAPRSSVYVRERVRLLKPALEVWVYCYNRPLDGRRIVRSGDWRVHVEAEKSARNP